MASLARIAVGSALMAGAAILAFGCAFKSGYLLMDTDGGAPTTKAYGPRGADGEYAWDETTVTHAGTTWDRGASAPVTFEEARALCRERGARLPSREELLAVSDVLGTDLLPSPSARGSEGGASWYWSASLGARPRTAWAVGLSGYANANDVTSKSLARCVRP